MSIVSSGTGQTISTEESADSSMLKVRQRDRIKLLFDGIGTIGKSSWPHKLSNGAVSTE
jgi:hypothetical protein